MQLKGSEPIDFTLSVNDLLQGKTVETDDIGVLQQLEESMKVGCANLKNLLLVMSTFGGEETFEI